MSKTEYAWVIQRDDGSRYFDCDVRYILGETDEVCRSEIY